MLGELIRGVKQVLPMIQQWFATESDEYRSAKVKDKIKDLLTDDFTSDTYKTALREVIHGLSNPPAELKAEHDGCVKRECVDSRNHQRCSQKEAELERVKNSVKTLCRSYAELLRTAGEEDRLKEKMEMSGFNYIHKKVVIARLTHFMAEFDTTGHLDFYKEFNDAGAFIACLAQAIIAKPFLTVPTGSIQIPVVGKSQIGKTTFLNALCCKVLYKMSTDEEGCSRLTREEGEEKLVVGDMLSACTLEMDVIQEFENDPDRAKVQRSSIWYIDCPGFGDSRGYEFDLALNSAIFMLLCRRDVQTKVILMWKADDAARWGQDFEALYRHTCLAVCGNATKARAIQVCARAEGGSPMIYETAKEKIEQHGGLAVSLKLSVLKALREKGMAAFEDQRRNFMQVWMPLTLMPPILDGLSPPDAFCKAFPREVQGAGHEGKLAKRAYDCLARLKEPSDGSPMTFVFNRESILAAADGCTSSRTVRDIAAAVLPMFAMGLIKLNEISEVSIEDAKNSVATVIAGLDEVRAMSAAVKGLLNSGVSVGIRKQGTVAAIYGMQCEGIRVPYLLANVAVSIMVSGLFIRIHGSAVNILMKIPDVDKQELELVKRDGLNLARECRNGMKLVSLFQDEVKEINDQDPQFARKIAVLAVKAFKVEDIEMLDNESQLESLQSFAKMALEIDEKLCDYSYDEKKGKHTTHHHVNQREARDTSHQAVKKHCTAIINHLSTSAKNFQQGITVGVDVFNQMVNHML